MASGDSNQPQYTQAQIQALMNLASSAQQQGNVAANSTDAWNHAMGLYQQNPGMLNYMSVPGTNNQLSLGQVGAAIQGMGGGANQAAQTGSQAGQVSNDPMNAATNLGAAVLGMPAIYNPMPMAPAAGAKGGVAKIGSPTNSGTVPNAPGGPWNTTAGVVANQQQAQGMQGWAQSGMGDKATLANAAAVEKAQGWAPGTVAQQFGPAATPTAQGPAPGTPTPTRPANAAAGGALAVPWATAPPAPSASAQPQGPIDWQAVAAHNTGLENAGKAIYAHLTGNDPNTATQAHIDAFGDHLGQHIDRFFGGGTPFGQAPQGAANYAQGAQPGVAATGATPMTALGVASPPTMPGAPPKMAAGGFVPGHGNRDKVHALLTPGEYVIPRAQAAQIFGGRAPVRMAGGGFVPPETRRQRITPPGAPPAAPSQAQSSSSQSSGDSANPSSSQGGGQSNWAQMAAMAQARNTMAQNAAIGANTPAYPSATTPAAQSYAAAANAGQVGGSAPSAATMQAASSMSPAATQGSIAQANMGGAQIGAAASTLAQGLAEAAKTYAASFKPWQMQQKAFGNEGTPNYQNVNLQQDATV